MTLDLHRVHRISACFIGVFLIIHLFNHLVAVAGVEAHIAMMDSLRRVYRIPVVEIILLVCVLYQVVSGLVFVKWRWGKRSGFFARLQAISGIYLALFMLNHAGAVLYGRALLELDTNFYFAVAGIHVQPFQYFFIPYYFLAVLALFIHLACAMQWLLRNKMDVRPRQHLGYVVIALGIIVASLIVWIMTGGLYDIDVPVEYKASYE